MTISMYQASVPGLIRTLNNLAAILDKASAHAAAKGFDSAVLVQSRLYPDMFPLSRQIQVATDMSKGCAARLAGQEPPSYADDETTLAQLVARIQKTIAFLKGFKPEQIDGSEQRQIKLQLRSGPVEFNGRDYLLQFVLPNVYFHVSMAYAILRHNGVEIGKRDYIGSQ